MTNELALPLRFPSLLGKARSQSVGIQAPQSKYNTQRALHQNLNQPILMGDLLAAALRYRTLINLSRSGLALAAARW